jgi:hypothetical protein
MLNNVKIKIKLPQKKMLKNSIKERNVFIISNGERKRLKQTKKNTHAFDICKKNTFLLLLFFKRKVNKKELYFI